MNKRINSAINLLVCFVILSVIVGCAGTEKTSPMSPEDVNVSQKLIPEELLKAGNLQILWENKLPMNPHEYLERLYLIEDHIYAMSNRNYIICLNRQTGEMVFSKPFTPVGFPVIGLNLYKNVLLSVVGNELLELDYQTGEQKASIRLDFGLTCPAVKNSSCYYVAGADNLIRAYKVEDRVLLFKVAADNDSAITSVVADDDIVIFATAAGNVVGITPDAPKKLWQFDTDDKVIGPIIKDSDSLYFASMDTYVYRISKKGKFSWKYQMPAILDTAPVATENAVYQYVRDKGMFAVDKNQGKLLWQLPGATEFLAQDQQQRVYVMTDTGDLAVVDNQNGKKLYSINFSSVTKSVSNIIDSNIYVADDIGRLVCLKPAR